MSDNCVDTIITDPPYGLLFMGANWDHGIPGVAYWREALRVAKPGATLMAFGGTRTYHRLACAIEDAGWEIRDCIMWVYGSGFPKSQNVSKAIDKAAGMEREIVGERPIAYPDSDCWGIPNKNDNGDVHKENIYTPPGNIKNGNRQITAPATPLAKKFDGYGSSLKPAYEPIVMAVKPMGQSYAANAEEWGVSGLWIDGGRVETNGDEVPLFTNGIERERNRSSYDTGGSNRTGGMSSKGRYP
jgi:site-specific DNA-methyltransferase (adenine-specific)